MNKKTKKAIIISSTLTSVAAISIATPLICLYSQNSNISNNNHANKFDAYNLKNEENIRNNPLGNKYYYVYENKRFYTLDDMAEYYIQKYDSLNSDYYIGDANDAISDYDSKIVDITKMRKYDKTRIFPAYKNSIGQYDHNYENVKKSYINPALVKYKYDDFNGTIFNTYEEAEKSILNSSSSNPLMYYELDNGYKFNPLSKNDLNLFKNDVFKKLNNKYKNPLFINENIDNELSIKIYDKNADTFTSAASELLTKPNLIRTMVQDIVMEYYNTKYEVLNETRTTKFDVRLSIKEYGDDGKKCKYVFQNTNGGNAYLEWGGKTLLFPNVSYKDLGRFSVFTNNELFFNNIENHKNSELPKMDLSIHKWAANRVARELKVTNMLGTNFDVKYVGSDHGFSKGVDIEIMKEGTEKPAHFIAFDVEFINKNDNFNTTVSKKFESKRAAIQKKYGNDSLITKLNNYIYSRVSNILSKTNNNSPKRIDMEAYIPVSRTPAIHQNQGDYKHSRAKQFSLETTRQRPTIENILENNFMIDDASEVDFINPTTKQISIERIVDDTKTLVNYIAKSSYKYIIEYNQKPLFEIDNIINTVNTENIYDFSFMNNVANYLNNDVNKTKLENWINVSQNFSTQFSKDGQINTIKKDSNNYIQAKLNYEWEFIQKGSEQLYPTDIIPSLNDQSSIDSYKISSIINVYNDLLRKLKTSNNWQMMLEKQFNAPKDVLFLYEKNQNVLVPKKLSYREYLDNGFNRSVSIYNNDHIKLFDNAELIKQAIETTLLLKPAKVIVLYDLLGNVINPGVRLTENETLQTTTDAIYDSENLIIDNLLRTKVIPTDDTKVFYQESMIDKYTLIDRRVNQIYKLNIDNRNTYFISFNDALRYLKDYLDLNAIKVGY